MNHVMIDLETLGNKPDAAFISVDAVLFEPETGELGQTFYERIDWESIKGRTMDASTVKWWMRQSEAARTEILREGKLYEVVMYSLHNWLSSIPNVVVWGNGATFDISILSDAFNHNPPWKFWNVRDVRTVVDMARGIVERDSIPFTGVPHHALNDAIHQAKYVSAMWGKLREKRLA